MRVSSVQSPVESSSCFFQDESMQQHHKKEIITKLIGRQNFSGIENKNGQQPIKVLQIDSNGVKRDYLLLKLGDFFTNPDQPMRSNLESIINYSHSRSTTDLSAIFIAINASDKSVQEFVRDIQEGKLSQDKAARLTDIICDIRSSQGVLVVGNKRMHLRYHESILHQVSEIAQIGESSSFFLPDSFTGTSQQTQRISAILEDKLLKLAPIEFNRLQIMQDSSTPQPSMSSSLISRLSIRKREKQESLIINDEIFTESLIEFTKEPPFGAGLSQQLIQEAAIHEGLQPASQQPELSLKRENVQCEIDLVSDDQDSAYMRQVKRLLTRDCESGKGGGKLVAIQGPRDTEEVVNSILSVLYQKKPSDIDAGKGLQKQPKEPKVVFIASQNNRLEQIQDTIENQFIKEATEPPFKLEKSQVSKAQKQKSMRKDQEQHESFRKIFDAKQVFVLLDRKFLSHLIYGELDISEVDYLIFDEVHNIYPESYYVDIMNKFIFNHKLMLSPEKNPVQVEDKKRLPKVLAFFSLDSVLQGAKNNDLQIMAKYYFMANAFNASLLCLLRQDLIKVERDIVREFSQSRVRNSQEIVQLVHQVQNCLEFLQKARKYLSFRKDGETRVTCVPESIIEKKKLQTYLFLETEFAKITLDEAMEILKELGAKLLDSRQSQQIDKQSILYKPTIESTQWSQKGQYFSSRIQFDEPLAQLMGKDIVKLYSTYLQTSIPSQKDQSENQSSWLYSPRMYLKKAKSESQAALEMCKILYSQGYLDQYLKPKRVRPSETLGISNMPSANSNYSKSTKSNSHHPQDEEEKMSFSFHSKSTMTSTEYSDIQSSIQRSDMDHPPVSYDSMSQFTLDNQNQMRPRAIMIDHVNNCILDEANEFFFNENKKNREKLYKGLEKGQHHKPIMHYNTRQLELFISKILNPTLKALNEYNYLCDTKSNPDLIRFDDLDVNMISESSIKDLLFQECFFYEKQGAKKVNQSFIQFKNYRQRMFNIYDNKNVQRNDQEYPQLVQMIDESLERYKFPHYMTQHLQNYYRQVRLKPGESAPNVKNKFNRKTFLTMLMIALSDKEPSTIEFEKVKNEMGRLAFVGDSVIILCQVITMIFSGKKSYSQKDLDTVKSMTVKTENLKKRAQKVGLDHLRIKAKYYQKTAPNPSVEGKQNPRDLEDIIKSLAGLFSIYLGFGATYLLLSDLGIVEPPTSDSMIRIGKISVQQKVQILMTISQNRQDLLNYERDKKKHLFDILCNEKHLGLNKEPIPGTEIVEIWKKLIKSRGLFMKKTLSQVFPPSEQTQLDEDDSEDELRDFSISVTYETTSTISDETLTCESNQASENSSLLQTVELQVEQEECKEQLPLQELSIDQQILQQFDSLSQSDTASTSEYLRQRCLDYSDAQITYAEEESKTGAQEVDEDINDETAKPNQSQVEIFERGYKELMQEGYEFKNLDILLQAIVHKSKSEKLYNSGTKFKDSSIIQKDIIMQYNLQILEYLGQSIVNFTISKLFYCETADSQKQWHGDFIVPTKLHDLKTWFSSNKWLSFALYENYYCTITEEIQNDADFKKSIFAKKAQESINQLKNKNISEKEAVEIAPRVSLIYDQNDKFEEQINEFNRCCFKQCLAADKNEVQKILNEPRENFNVTNKSLSLKLFKNKDVQQQQQNEVDFSEIEQKFAKYFSDVMEAVVGGIFMDSGDLDKTQMVLLKLLNCPSVSAFPIVQFDRTAVLSVFNSKPYCKGIKLYHNMEEKDGNIFIMGYMGKLQFRRLKYSKERKKKVQLFYYDMRLYLEDAYKEFEQQFVNYRKIDDEKGPTNDEWLEFNKNYRKTWNVKLQSGDQKRYSAIKEAAKKLFKFVTSAEEKFKTRENQNITEMRDQIITYLEEGLQHIGANPKSSLLVLESERVQSSKIRELLQCSDIKFIDCLSYGMKDVGNFVHKLNNRQVQQFYEHLIEFGKN